MSSYIFEIIQLFICRLEVYAVETGFTTYAVKLFLSKEIGNFFVRNVRVLHRLA